MESNELIIKMVPTELELLSNAKSKPSILRSTVFGAILCVVIFVIGFIYIRSLYPFGWSVFKIFLLVLLIALLALLEWIIVQAARARKRNIEQLNKLIEKDLQEGLKKIITRRVDRQDVDTHWEQGWGSTGVNSRAGYSDSDKLIVTYEMFIDGRLYISSKELFDALKDGDWIEFHVALNSGYILYYTIEGDRKLYPPSSLQRK